NWRPTTPRSTAPPSISRRTKKNHPPTSDPSPKSSTDAALAAAVSVAATASAVVFALRAVVVPMFGTSAASRARSLPAALMPFGMALPLLLRRLLLAHRVFALDLLPLRAFLLQAHAVVRHGPVGLRPLMAL